MNEITLKDYRCFHERQTARLAPLTLLVGENSTGKTSFMALVRALWDVAYRYHIPDFKEEPYDLGSFDETVHYRGARAGRSDSFEARFSARHELSGNNGGGLFDYKVIFEEIGTASFPTQRRRAYQGAWIQEHLKGKDYILRVGTHGGTWEKQVPAEDAARGFSL